MREFCDIEAFRSQAEIKGRDEAGSKGSASIKGPTEIKDLRCDQGSDQSKGFYLRCDWISRCR